MNRKLVTAARLREVLSYEPDTGEFRWLIAASTKVKAGRRAGNARGRRYRQITIDGVKYLARRLAWFYCTGSWPDGHVGDRNGDSHDNRIENLKMRHGK